MNIAIIGSAGRYADAKYVTPAIYSAMLIRTYDILSDIPGKHVLVSGGAAFADHVAVSTFCQNKGQFDLELHLPTAWDYDKNEFVDDRTGRTANYYHREFSTKMGAAPNKSLSTLGTIIRTCNIHVHGGFYERNSYVAQADAIIAFTESTMGVPKAYSGTADTWYKAKTKLKRHFNLADIAAELA